MNTHGFSYLPVPVGTGTISPSIPDTKNKPGSSSQQQSKQMPFPGFPKSPARDIEQGKSSMENYKENIEEREPHHPKIQINRPVYRGGFDTENAMNQYRPSCLSFERPKI